MTSLAVSNAPTNPSLVTLEEATRLLAEIHRVDLVKGIIDKAEAARVYARQAKLGLQAVNHAQEIKARAERRMGQLLKEVIPHEGGNPQLSRRATVGGSPPPRLADLDISRSQSSRSQQMAAIPDETFEAHIAEQRARGREITTQGLLKLVPKAPYVPPERPPVDHTLLHPQDRFTVCDAHDLRKHWEPGRVNLWVTSPPYALDIQYEGGDVPSYEEWLDAMRNWLEVMYDLTEPEHGRLALNIPLDRDLGGWEAVSSDIVWIARRELHWRFRTWIIWNEGNAGAGTDRGSVDSASAPNITAPVESVIVFYRGHWNRPGPAVMDHDDWLNLCGPRGLWEFGGEHGDPEVPAPFPEELPRRVISSLSFPDDIVADPFCGRGTTGAVGARMGRVVWLADRSASCVERSRLWVAGVRQNIVAAG